LNVAEKVVLSVEPRAVTSVDSVSIEREFLPTQRGAHVGAIPLVQPIDDQAVAIGLDAALNHAAACIEIDLLFRVTGNGPQHQPWRQSIIDPERDFHAVEIERVFDLGRIAVPPPEGTIEKAAPAAEFTGGVGIGGGGATL
jgi:hypothetical protein